MPTPQQITSTATTQVVWSIDNDGTTSQEGGLMLAGDASPEPTTAGHIQLYSPDAESLWTQDASGIRAIVSAGSGTTGGLDWINVKAFGATGNGTTDDTTAMQNALNATAPGGICYMPLGVYRTSAPLTIPPYVTLMGTHGSDVAQSTTPHPYSCIKPLASFAGVAVISILDAQLGGYSTTSSEQTLEKVTIDGTSLVATVDGVRGTGQVQGWRMRDVHVRDVTGIGLNTAFNLSAPPGPQAPFVLHWERVSVWNSGSHGVALNNSTDSFFSDVYIIGCNGYGWFIAGSGSSTWVGCRAEWNDLDGFNLSTNGGIENFVGCSTDRNAQNGWSIPASASTGMIVMTGCRATRDGSSSTSGGYAGVKVGATARSVIIDQLTTQTGANDDGSGLTTPQYGVSVTGATYVSLQSGIINAVSAGILDGGSNTTFLIGPGVTGTGITAWNWPGTAGTTTTNGTALAQSWRASGDSVDRFSVDGSGKHTWGPGNAAQDLNLYRAGNGVLRTDFQYQVGLDLKVTGAGHGLFIAEGSNCKSGRLVLNGATPVVVANTSVTANSEIQLTHNVPGGTPAFAWISGRNPGTSFTVTGTAGDTSTLAYFIVEPA